MSRVTRSEPGLPMTTIVGLINGIGHRKEIRSDEGLTLETSAFESLYGGQYIVIPLNSNTFSDWRRTRHVSWVKPTNSLWTYDYVIVLREIAANLWASRRKANDFFAVFSSFKLGGITLKDWSRGKQWVLFPLDLNVSQAASGNIEIEGKWNSLFPMEPLKVFVINPVDKNQIILYWISTDI